MIDSLFNWIDVRQMSMSNLNKTILNLLVIIELTFVSVIVFDSNFFIETLISSIRVVYFGGDSTHSLIRLLSAEPSLHPLRPEFERSTLGCTDAG